MKYRGFSSGPQRGERGLASIVVVSVLIVIMTLITIGFTRLVNRSAVNSANRQFSASATYAAQSGINDVASYLKKYAVNNPGSTLLPKSTTCTGDGSLIGNTAHPGPFYGRSTLSSNSTTQYSCLLLNPTPSSLVYTQVQNFRSQVVKINTSASAGALDKLLVSWQPSDSQITGYPVSASNLNDETTWNSSTGICKDSGGVNASCIPILRVAIFPISNGETLSSAQAQSKTVFLYPQGSGVTVPVKPYGGLSDGSLVPIACTQNIGGSSNFNPNTNTGYKCNVIISSLASAIAPGSTDSVYMRITPIYNQADVRLAVNDKFGNSLNFINDQAIVDVTAQTSGVVKRLQGRVDTSSLTNGATSIDTNISSNSNNIPEQSVRSANALCKREVVTTPSLPGFPPFINFDDPDGVCHDLSSTTAISDPVPTLNFSITGNDGTDAGRTVDSAANNPDSPQSPVQQGTVYISSGATLNWATTEATSCAAAGGWSGEKLTSVSGPTRAGSGSQSIGGISSVTEYDLTCSRPGAPATTPTKKVFAWPPPISSISGPSSVNAGDNYTISWSSNNAAVRCSLGGGNWSDSSQTGTTGAETMNWPWNDSSSTRTFTVTCYDPISRGSNVSTWVVRPGGGSSAITGVNPPSCSGSASITNNSGWSWSYQASCPNVSPYNGGYHINSTIPELPSGDVPAGQAVPGYIGPIFSRGANYCIQIIAWIPGWGSAASPNFTSPMDCKNVFDPMNITSFQALTWDEGPVQCNAASGANGQWLCRNNASVINAQNGAHCADGVHRWTVCAGGVTWNVSGGGGTVTCTAAAAFPYGNFITATGTSFSSGINYGWGNFGSPYPYALNCSDSYGNSAPTAYY